MALEIERKYEKTHNTNLLKRGLGQEALLNEIEKMNDGMAAQSEELRAHREIISGLLKILAEKSPVIDLSGIPQIKGDSGHTPIKGKDYFTDEEVFDFLQKITPQKGTHYFTTQEINDFLSAITPIKGTHYFDGENGKPGKSIQGPRGKPGIPGPKGYDGEIGPAPRHKWLGTKLMFEKPDLPGGSLRPDGKGIEIFNISVYNTNYGQFYKNLEEFTKSLQQRGLFQRARFGFREVRSTAVTEAHGATTYERVASQVNSQSAKARLRKQAGKLLLRGYKGELTKKSLINKTQIVKIRAVRRDCLLILFVLDTNIPLW